MINISDFLLMLSIIVVLFSLLGAIKILSYLLQRKSQSHIVHRISIDLSHIVFHKEQMDGERTTNHQFDKTKTFSQKLDAGSDSLEEYKRKRNISICQNYRMG